MNKKIITILIVLMGISILGIIAVQLVWMNNAIRVKNELFSRGVNEALNSTVEKLEKIHNFGVVNQMIFNDSIHWMGNSDFDYDFDFDTDAPPLPKSLHLDSLRRPPRPVRLKREFNPQKGNTRLEIKIDTTNNNQVQTYTYSYNLENDSNKEHIVLNSPSANGNQVFVFKKDTLISAIDSLYSVSVVKIDSLLTHLDTLSVIRPDLSKRMKVKARNLKRTANQVVTEIVSWDVQDVDKDLVKKVLSEELQNRDIPIDFEFGIEKDSTIDLAPGTTDSLKLAKTNYKVELYPNGK